MKKIKNAGDKLDMSFRTTCPICNKKLTSQGFEQHRKEHHKNLTHTQFEQLVIDAIRSGKSKVKIFEAVNPSLSSATRKLQDVKHASGNNFYRLQQGGKVSPK
ncbi:hypothetical protein NI379_06820 [Vibrio parahaemolyticus]|nr:hypothetical protein [Vibrio parahaemolyticus]WMO01690.1 hypothetical protein NI379_06230 [Vibrio parahaemolyticus]WMO01767.1 hypothetical protein NI379_06820 [Vibrio parahaemolyticus]